MEMLGKQMLAADYGASGGRVMLGSFDGEKISLGAVSYTHLTLPTT